MGDLEGPCRPLYELVEFAGVAARGLREGFAELDAENFSRQEPSAVAPHAWDLCGGRGQPSVLPRLGDACNSSGVEVQPALLRRGTAVRTSEDWGRHSGIDWDTGDCFWAHNAHAVSGSPNSWTSTVGEFCFDTTFIFGDGFESGTLTGWCQ